jgi:hypothetical protein
MDRVDIDKFCEEAEIGLIDWEFAGEERVFHDLGQLSAWLHLFAHIDGWSFNEDDPSSSSDISPANERVTNSRPWIFAEACFTAYARQLHASSLYSWILDADSPVEERYRLQVIRSTWILHGRELIFDVTLPEVAHKFERILHSDIEGWKRKVVELGCWYVRVAAETTDIDFKAALQKEEFLSLKYQVMCPP